jgi:SAM-dependent methyltransferase
LGEAFRRSAALYDAIYAELPTEAECDALLALFAGHGVVPRTLIDLGCGTGRHAAAWARRGLEVVGVDRSPEMIALACRHGVDARLGDLEAVRLGRTFDAAAAMFHVIAYVVDDEALSRVFATARAHLQPGGLFFFDTWSARAVEAVPPETRERVVGRIVRRGTPTRRGSTVEVRYDFDADGERFTELHVLRPRDAGALSESLQRAGFRVLTVIESPTSYDLRVLAVATDSP